MQLNHFEFGAGIKFTLPFILNQFSLPDKPVPWYIVGITKAFSMKQKFRDNLLEKLSTWKSSMLVNSHQGGTRTRSFDKSKGWATSILITQYPLK